MQVVVALLTPFDAHGKPDLGALSAHVASLLEGGVDALMPCGTTGEGVLLDEDEAIAVIRATVEAAGGEAKVLAHVGRASTSGTVRLATQALDEGVEGISALVPYFYTYSEEQLLRHFLAVMDAAGGAPAYAYTLPERTSNDLSAKASERSRSTDWQASRTRRSRGSCTSST